MLRVQILVIAVLMKAVMQRTFNVFQWEALLLLVAGITVNQLNYCTCAVTACAPCPCPLIGWGMAELLLSTPAAAWWLLSSCKGCAMDSLSLACEKHAELHVRDFISR